MGSADGSAVTRLEYSPAGEQIGPGSGAGSYAHDADADVDLDDFAAYVSCLGASAESTALCLAFHDANAVPARREADGDVDLEDFAGFQHCFSGSGQPPPPDCFRPAPEGVPPGPGSFALHGGMVDVLSSGREGPDDALALQYSRARYFDLTHGRFLQRDPTGYADGSNLYEAFASNPARFTDPMGTGLEPTEAEFTATWMLEPVSEKALQEHGAAQRRFWVLVGHATVGLGERAYANVTGMAQLQDTFDPFRNLWDLAYHRRTPRGIAFALNIGNAAKTQYLTFTAAGDPWYGAAVATFGTGLGEVCPAQNIWDIVTNEDRTAGYVPFESGEAYARHVGGAAFDVALWLAPLKIIPRSTRPVANPLDDLGRAGVNVVDDGVRAGTGTVDDAARAAGAAGKEVKITRSKHPQAAQHLEDAGGTGRSFTVDRAGTDARRRSAMEGHPTRPGLDRDEVPPAVFREGGRGSSVRYLTPADNRGAGAAIGNQIRDVPDGGLVIIRIDD